MHRRVLPLLIAFASLIGCQSHAPQAMRARIEQHLHAPDYLPKVPSEHASIEDRLAHYRVPGVSVAVIDHGQVVWAMGYGTADVQTRAPVDEHTLFHGASLSKTVNAITVMTLVQDGKLDLDKPINEQLKEWKLSENQYTRQTPITLRRLLSHTAGMGLKYMGLGTAADAPKPTTLVDLLNGAPPATQPVQVVEPPGKRFVYSGGAIAIAQLMLQEAAGSDNYPQVVKQRVFDPLGMTETTFEQTLSDTQLAHVAPGYKGGKRVNGPERVYAAMSAAGIWTTPEDYAKVVLEIQHAIQGKGEKVLSSGAVLAMCTPYITNLPNASGRKSTVGAGVFLAGEGPSRVFFHVGSHAGYSAYFVGRFEAGQGVVVMTNGDDAFDLIGEIVQTVADAYGWPDYHFIPPPKAPAATTSAPSTPESRTR